MVDSDYTTTGVVKWSTLPLVGKPFIYVTVGGGPGGDGGDYGSKTPGTVTNGIMEAVIESIALWGTCRVMLGPGTFVMSNSGSPIWAVDPTNNGAAGNGGFFVGSGRLLTTITWATGGSGVLFGWDQPNSKPTSWTVSDFGVQGPAGTANWANGVALWVNSITYPIGTFVSTNNGFFYVSIAAGNLNISPPNTAYWQRILPPGIFTIVENEGGSRHHFARLDCFETSGISACGTWSVTGSEDCIVEGVHTTNNSTIPNSCFGWGCPGGALTMIDCVTYDQELFAVNATMLGGALRHMNLEAAGVPSVYTLDQIFWNGNASLTGFYPLTIADGGGSSKEIHITLIDCYESAWKTNLAWIGTVLATVHAFIKVQGSYLYGDYTTTPAVPLIDLTSAATWSLNYTRSGYISLSHCWENGTDCRQSLTAADGSPIPLQLKPQNPTQYAGNGNIGSIYQVTIMVYDHSGGTPGGTNTYIFSYTKVDGSTDNTTVKIAQAGSAGSTTTLSAVVAVKAGTIPTIQLSTIDSSASPLVDVVCNMVEIPMPNSTAGA